MNPRDIIRVGAQVAIIIVLAFVTLGYLQAHPSWRTAAALLAAWGGGVLVNQLWDDLNPWRRR